MNNRKKWISTKIRLGWMFLAAGVIVAAAGILIGVEYSHLPYNFRIITGLGILLIGVGIGYLVRYKSAQKDEQSARRISVEERDERTVAIRSRAGNRAFLVETGLVYIGLMWVSFAANGSLPPLEGDTLWFFLAAAMLIPFAVYIGSILVDQQNT